MLCRNGQLLLQEEPWPHDWELLLCLTRSSLPGALFAFKVSIETMPITPNSASDPFQPNSFCASPKVWAFQCRPFDVPPRSFCFSSVAIHESQGLLCHTKVCAYGLGKTASGGERYALVTLCPHHLLATGDDISSSHNQFCGVDDLHSPGGDADQSLACPWNDGLQWSPLPPSLPGNLLFNQISTIIPRPSLPAAGITNAHISG